MSFSTDRDLLVIDPQVFSDAVVIGQQRLKVSDGVVSGTTLTSALADFEQAEVGAGGVVLINGVPCEVISRTNANTLEISLLRSSMEGAAIGPGDGSGVEVVVRSFGPQAGLVYGVLLRLIGIDPDDAGGGLTADAVVSRELMARLEALGTLERVYSGVVSLVGDNQEAKRKSEDYRGRFGTACRAATVLLDLDGDGVADVRRSLGGGLV